MNLSGQAMLELYTQYFKNILSSDQFVTSLIIVHDDIALKMYDIKFKDGTKYNGLGGHNGLKSIANAATLIGAKNYQSFSRIRMGCYIKQPFQLKDYLLKKMEPNVVLDWQTRIENFIKDLIKGNEDIECFSTYIM